MAIICTNCSLTNIPKFTYPPSYHPSLDRLLFFSLLSPFKRQQKGRRSFQTQREGDSENRGTKNEETKDEGQRIRGQRAKGQRGTKLAEKHSTESKKRALERQNTKFSTKKIKKSVKNLELSDISFIFAPAIQTELPHGGCSSVG